MHVFTDMREWWVSLYVWAPLWGISWPSINAFTVCCCTEGLATSWQKTALSHTKHSVSLDYLIHAATSIHGIKLLPQLSLSLSLWEWDSSSSFLLLFLRAPLYIPVCVMAGLSQQRHSTGLEWVEQLEQTAHGVMKESSSSNKTAARETNSTLAEQGLHGAVGGHLPLTHGSLSYSWFVSFQILHSILLHQHYGE